VQKKKLKHKQTKSEKNYKHGRNGKHEQLNKWKGFAMAAA
jgi:hypothetical protein